VRRFGEKIDSYPLKGGVNTGITYSLYYEGLDAAVWAGATLDELEKWYNGGYDSKFMSVVVALYRAHEQIEIHTRQAVSPKERK